jgi:ankyrin repeat protein
MNENKIPWKDIAVFTVIFSMPFLGYQCYQYRYPVLIKMGIQPNNVCSSDMNIAAIDRYLSESNISNINVKVDAPDDFITESLNDHDRRLSLLNCAIKFDKTEIVENLLKRGADPSLFDYYSDQKFRTTSLHDAVRYSKNEKIVNLLLERGANPNLTDDNGDTPLHMIAYSIARIYYHSGNKCYHREEMPFDMLSLFIKYKADPNLKNNLGNTPLHLIAKEERPIEYDHLIKLGGNPLLKNNKGETAQQLKQSPKKHELLCKS